MDFKYIKHNAWQGMLSEAFGRPVNINMDNTDIQWEDFYSSLPPLSPRDIIALQSRYGDKMTFKEIGKKIMRLDGKGPLTNQGARLALDKALRKLRHPKRRKMFEVLLLKGA